MPFIDADGLTVHYDLTGPANAPVLLLANSIGTSLHIWDATLPALTQRFRVLRYDMRGHGLTGVSPVGADSGYSMDRLADDAVALLDALGVGRAHVCGLSIGGMMAQRLAVKAPERVDGLILCDTAGLIGPPSIWADRIAAIRANGLGSIAEGVMARWFTERFRAERPDLIRGYVAMLSRTPVDGYVGCSMAIRDADLRADNARIVAPTLVVVGSEDLATSPALARELADGIPGARFAILPDAAHIPCVERPAELAALILEFLNGLSAPAEMPERGLYDRGMTVRRAVLGDAHVDRSLARASDFDRDFQEFITKTAWGSIWTRPGLDRRTRSLLTIAMLAALGHDGEFKLHIRATRNTGVTRDEVKEVLLQAAVYAGVPAANHAIALARAVYAEMDAEEAGASAS